MRFTINLNINEARSNQESMAINPDICISLLIKENWFRVDDLPSPGPQIFSQDVTISQNEAVVELYDFFTHPEAKESPE